MAVVNKSSSKREAAYQVLLSITSDEVQTAISKAGRMPVLTKQEILDVFGQDSGLFEKKNLKNIFLMKPAPLPEASKFDPKINALLNGEVTRNVVIDRMDINTALRNAEEKANKEIVAPMLNQ
jgi:multiple sugar transport system substrate-binding protein